MNGKGLKHQVLIAFSGVLVSEKPSSQNFVLSFSISSKKSYQTALITKYSSAYSTPNWHLVQLQKRSSLSRLCPDYRTMPFHPDSVAFLRPGMLFIPAGRNPQRQSISPSRPQDARFFVGKVSFPKGMVAGPRVAEGNPKAPGRNSWYVDLPAQRLGFPCCGSRFPSMDLY